MDAVSSFSSDDIMDEGNGCDPVSIGDNVDCVDVDSSDLIDDILNVNVV